MSDEATWFNPDESPPGNRVDDTVSFTKHYKRLQQAHNETWDGGFRDEARATDDDHSALCEAVASALSLTPYQRERAATIVSDLPNNHFRGNRNVVVVLAVCAIVGRRDGRDYHPSVLDTPESKVRSQSGQEIRAFAEKHDIDRAEFQPVFARVSNDV